MGTASDTTLMLARLSYSTICDSKKIGGTRISIFLRREPFPAGNSIQISTRKPDTSETFSPSVRPCFGLPFCSRRTLPCFPLPLLARTFLPMVSPLPTSWQWPLALLFTVSSACFFPIASPESTSKNGGHFFPLSPSGAPLRFPFLCISIPPGPTHTQPLPWPCFSG